MWRTITVVTYQRLQWFWWRFVDDCGEASHGDYRCVRASLEAWLVAMALFHREEHGDGLGFLIPSTNWEIKLKQCSKVEKTLIPFKFLMVIMGASKFCLRRDRWLWLRFVERNNVFVSEFWYDQRAERLSQNSTCTAKLLTAITYASKLCLRRS